jgi:signal transduction histidine kinase/DNA-binding response OmpR family regulator
MFKAGDQSIARRITWMNMLVSGTALLLACSAFIGYDLATFRTATMRSLSAQARIISSSSISALLFDDPQPAAMTLSALKESPNVISAVIYDTRGKVFASYLRSPDVQIPPELRLPSQKIEMRSIQHREIVLVRSIFVDGKQVGTIYIRSSTQELRDRLTLYIGISIVVLIGSLLAALLVSSVFRRIVANPLIRLAGVAKVISLDKNYSLRVEQIDDKNELAILINSFNGMLDQIQRSEEDLRKAQSGLEQRVQERTAELLAAKEEVERASKFKDQFLSTMSHELRTPLNAILGFSEMLTAERYGVLNDRQRRYVNHIHAGGRHLLRLINDILDISQIEAGRLHLSIEPVSVHPSLAEVIDSLQPLAEKKSQSLVVIKSSDLSVLADFIRFKQILMNLVGNAIKFTPEGGRIEVRARRQDGMVRVEVHDSGAGISLEEQSQIFDAFHRIVRAGNASEGTGLGLAITRSLVELHGGQLGVESQPGQGSRFYFTLPITQVLEKQGVYRSDSGVHRSLSASILVIDDELASAQILESQLSSVGYKVLLCTEPQRAVEMAALVQPAAITLDIVMKPVNGWEILSQLKSDPRTASIPVVVVTILDQKNTGVLLGANDYIVKPVNTGVLLNSIARCLDSTGGNGKAHPILLVEDHLPTCEFVSEMLSRNKYRVRVAANGTQARTWVQDELPSLVILDLILPDVSGFQLLTEWRSDVRTAELPVIVLTNKDLTTDELKYLRDNVGALFNKQDQWQDSLLRQIRQALPFPVPELSR